MPEGLVKTAGTRDQHCSEADLQSTLESLLTSDKNIKRIAISSNPHGGVSIHATRLQFHVDDRLTQLARMFGIPLHEFDIVSDREITVKRGKVDYRREPITVGFFADPTTAYEATVVKLGRSARQGKQLNTGRMRLRIRMVERKSGVRQGETSAVGGITKRSAPIQFPGGTFIEVTGWAHGSDLDGTRHWDGDTPPALRGYIESDGSRTGRR